MSCCSARRVAVVTLATACALAAQGQTDTTDVSVTISNCSDTALTLTLRESLKPPMLPPPESFAARHTNSAPSATRMGSMTNEVRHLARPVWEQIPAKQSITIKIPPGEYSLGAAAAAPPSPRDRHHLKVVMPLNGYISITNKERWVFSSSLDKKGQDEVLSWEFWKWQLEVPSRPGFLLSQLPEHLSNKSPLPGIPARPPPSGYQRSEPDRVRLPLPASKATPTNSQR